MKLNYIVNTDKKIVGLWITDKNKEDIIEAAFEGEPKHTYPKGFQVGTVNVIGDKEMCCAMYWKNVQASKLQTVDPTVLKAMWFDEFGSLKVNS